MCGTPQVVPAEAMSLSETCELMERVDRNMTTPMPGSANFYHRSLDSVLSSPMLTGAIRAVYKHRRRTPGPVPVVPDRATPVS